MCSCQSMAKNTKAVWSKVILELSFFDKVLLTFRAEEKDLGKD